MDLGVGKTILTERQKEVHNIKTLVDCEEGKDVTGKVKAKGIYLWVKRKEMTKLSNNYVLFPPQCKTKYERKKTTISWKNQD
ncbi:unnamed protein product [Linum trigynum]|uniref:Uncharacterized protein n=1 Tax=Linum trigynum TaxID=586398 RepID=A0AAV2FKB3_9ROSI